MNRRAYALGAAMALFGNVVAVALVVYAQSAFLQAYGAARVPYLLIASAGGFAVATLGYDAITRRAHTRVVDLVLLGVLAAVAATAPTMLRADVPPVVLVVALTAVAQVCTLALWNRVAASVAGRDARRMLPRAGAAATAGGAIAGLGAGALIPRIGADAIPQLAAVIAVIAAIVCVLQQRALAAGGSPGAAAPVGGTTTLGSPQRALLRGLILIALLEAIVSTTIDLKFQATLKHRYSGEALAVAVALFAGGTNAVLLLLQIFAVPRLLVTRSLPFSATIHPVLVSGWYALYAIVPSFASLAGTRTSDQVLHLATSRTSQELALSALPPGPRARWKVLLRGAFGPAGVGIAGVGLLLAGPAAISERGMLAAVAIAIALAWWRAAYVTARRFAVALAAPLGVMRARRDDPIRIDLETLERWTTVAGADDPRTAALARAALTRARIDASDLGEYLRHDSAAVRAALFDQLARVPTPSLRAELRAAVAIEDDDRALARGIKALAVSADDSGLERGHARSALSDEVAVAVRSAEQTLRGGDAMTELGVLCARDPSWAIALVRARRGELPDAILAPALAAAAAIPERRAGALAVIVRFGPAAVLSIVVDDLLAGTQAATAVIAELDADDAGFLSAALPGLAAPVRAAIARASAGAPAATPLLAALIGDRDPDVAHPALRTALAVARGGGRLPAAPIAAAHEAALAATVAHLDARDAIAAGATWSACARHELELATRRCVARLLWTAAVEAATAGRDPAPLAATARHLIGDREADRRRALDVVQELATERPAMLAVIERWLRPARARTDADATRDAGADAAIAAIAPFDRWLANLVGNSQPEREARITTLRRSALFASVSGPVIALLADDARPSRVTGGLFALGDAGDDMFVVMAGSLVAHRPGHPERIVPVNGVVGEVAVLTHAPRASTVVAIGDDVEVLRISRALFATAARSAPELVLGLSATLAGWLAPGRADVL